MCVLSCPSYAWGLMLVFYVALVVCVSFCCRYMLPKLCLWVLLVLYVAPVVCVCVCGGGGGSIGVLCCPSYALGLLLVFMLPQLCV